MKLVLEGSVVKIGLSRELHTVLNDIYYLNIERAPIIKVADTFFRAFELFEKIRDPDLWIFLYDSEVRERLMAAFGHKNHIDARILQQALNDRSTYISKMYVHAFIKGAYDRNIKPVPEKWISIVNNRRYAKHTEFMRDLRKSNANKYKF